MSVPKKKKSKGKRNQRHAIWKGKAAIAAEKALSIGKSVLTGRAQGFVYPMNESAEEEWEKANLRTKLKSFKNEGISGAYPKIINSKYKYIQFWNFGK